MRAIRSSPGSSDACARNCRKARGRSPSPGLKRIVDFQDVAYGDDYIDRLRKLAALDTASGGEAKNFAFTVEAAKRLAVAMAYDDVIRVADIDCARLDLPACVKKRARRPISLSTRPSTSIRAAKRSAA